MPKYSSYTQLNDSLYRNAFHGEGRAVLQRVQESAQKYLNNDYSQENIQSKSSVIETPAWRYKWSQNLSVLYALRLAGSNLVLYSNDTSMIENEGNLNDA